MGTTFKAVVYKHHKKADGTYNVKIRVTHNRQKRHISTNIYVTKDDLTRGYKIKSQNVLDNTKSIVENYQRIASTIGIQDAKEMNVDDVIKYIDGYNPVQTIFKLDFIKFGEDTVRELIDAGNIGNSHVYATCIRSLKQFVQRDEIDVSEITVQFLRDYCKWLQTKPARKNRPDKTTGRRTPSLYLSTIRAIHNKAKRVYNDEDAGIINIPLSPFKRLEMPQLPVSRKRALKQEQLTLLMQLPYEEVKYRGVNRWNLAKDIFMLSFGLIGMNEADLYNCTSFRNGIITYNRTKTKNRRKDGAVMVIEVPTEVIPLVEKYRDKTGKRVFNFYQLYASKDVFTTAINKGLKKFQNLIGESDLEFYAARHTWATLARNKVKIEKLLIHEALNHVDEKMRVTDVYIEKDWAQINDANKKVLKYVKFDVGSVIEPHYERANNK